MKGGEIAASMGVQGKGNRGKYTDRPYLSNWNKEKGHQKKGEKNHNSEVIGKRIWGIKV